MLKRVFPSCHANTPLIAGLESAKSPLRMRRDQIVAIENGKIEEFASHQDAYGMESNVFWSRSTIAVAVKTG